jgi:hypothetical protein
MLSTRCAPLKDGSKLATEGGEQRNATAGQIAPLGCQVNPGKVKFADHRYEGVKFAVASDPSACNFTKGSKMMLKLGLDLSQVKPGPDGKSPLEDIASCFIATNVPIGENGKNVRAIKNQLPFDRNSPGCAYSDFQLSTATPNGDYVATVGFTDASGAGNTLFSAEFGIRIGDLAETKQEVSDGSGTVKAPISEALIDPELLCNGKLERGGTNTLEPTPSAAVVCANRIDGISTCDRMNAGHLFACQGSGWTQATGYLKCAAACFRCPLGTPDICLDDPRQVEALRQNPEQSENIIIATVIDANSGKPGANSETTVTATTPDLTQNGTNVETGGTGQTQNPLTANQPASTCTQVSDCGHEAAIAYLSSATELNLSLESTKACIVRNMKEHNHCPGTGDNAPCGCLCQGDVIGKLDRKIYGCGN